MVQSFGNYVVSWDPHCEQRYHWGSIAKPTRCQRAAWNSRRDIFAPFASACLRRQNFARCWEACTCAAQPETTGYQPESYKSPASASDERYDGHHPVMEQFIQVADLPIGRLSIGKLDPGEVAAISVLVTRAFAGSPEAFSFRDIKQYIEELSEDPRESLVLVGRLKPTDTSITLPDGSEERLAGVIMMSFVPSTREAFPSLQPPSQHAYISNTAVDASLQRQGIGRALLVAAEEACRAEGHEAVTLHARLADSAALKLYEQAGFEEMERDGWSLTRRYRPRVLLMKCLIQTNELCDGN